MRENDYLEILKFYKTTNKLKNLIRTGWKMWNVSAERIESVAEHIVGTQMLALALNSQFKLGIDIERVIYLLAIHEIGETAIGDITPYDGITREEKHEREMKAVQEILGGLFDYEYIFNAFNEFENRSTIEGEFAHLCDKLEADLQCKMYDDLGAIDMTKTNSLTNAEREKLQQYYLSHGITKCSDLWFEEDIKAIKYPKEYVELLRFLQKTGFNNI